MSKTLLFNTEFNFSTDENGTLKVSGKSFQSGYIKNKHVIIPNEELDNVVKTLKEGIDGNGAYILKDHGYKGGLLSPKSVDLLVGRVTNAFKKKNEVFYEGRIEDVDMADKIRKKLVSASSIGLNIESMKCSICGRELGSPECYHKIGTVYANEPIHNYAKPYVTENVAAIYATGLRALEQSIVLFPAIEGASITAKFNFDNETESWLNEINKNKDDINDDANIKQYDVEDIKDHLYQLAAEDLLKKYQMLMKMFEETSAQLNHKNKEFENLSKRYEYLLLTKEELDEKYADYDEELVLLIGELKNEFKNRSNIRGTVNDNEIEESIEDTAKEDLRKLIFDTSAKKELKSFSDWRKKYENLGDYK